MEYYLQAKDFLYNHPHKKYVRLLTSVNLLQIILNDYFAIIYNNTKPAGAEYQHQPVIICESLFKYALFALVTYLLM
jgi:hypothetical protein